MTITVKGMSCAHCKAAVTSALEELGLSQVQVDLAAGTATFQDNAAVSMDAIREAVDDAGFELG